MVFRKILFYLLFSLIIIAPMHCNPPEIYQFDSFSAFLLEGDAVRNFYPLTGTANIEFGNKKTEKEGKFLEFKDFKLELIECGFKETLPTIDDPATRFIFNAKESILIQSKSKSWLLYEHKYKLHADSLTINKRFKSQVLYRMDACFHVSPDKYEEILSILRKQGKKEKYLEKLVYSSDLIERGDGKFGQYLLLIAILIGNTFICFKFTNYGRWTFVYWLISSAVVIYRFFS